MVRLASAAVVITKRMDTAIITAYLLEELEDFPEDESLPLPLDNDGPLPKALEKMGFRSLGYENSAKSYMLDTPRLIIVMERDFSDLLHWSIRHWPPGDVMLTVSKYKHENQVLDYLKHLFKLYGI